MILTCPRCATRYVVGEDQVGPQGRKVKCAACGELWMALPDEEPIAEAAESPPEPYEVAPPETEDFVVAAADPPDAPAFEMPAAAPSQAELLDTMRKRARRRQSGGRTVLWASLATVVAVGVVAVVFRAEIARAWPPAARGYAAMGMPVR
jgi:predicted Zn finger-like uncharacterized protein